jgi:hypothetical protein
MQQQAQALGGYALKLPTPFVWLRITLLDSVPLATLPAFLLGGAKLVLLYLHHCRRAYSRRLYLNWSL